VLPVLLLMVAGAAAVLSFAALRDLALVCGFTGQLAWLLPVVVDAGAAAGSLVWLGVTTGATARAFARGLATSLLGLSVAANALGHGLAAYAVAPPWWVVVAVSAVSPAVLGAVVHLAVLVGRGDPAPAGQAGDPWPTGDPSVPLGRRDPDQVRAARLAGMAPTDTCAAADRASIELNDQNRVAELGGQDRAAESNGQDRAAELIALGAGRRRLSRELGVTEYEARQLLARARTDIDPEPATESARGGQSMWALGSEPAAEQNGADPGVRVLDVVGRPR
jgi:hypothetical protein